MHILPDSELAKYIVQQSYEKDPNLVIRERIDALKHYQVADKHKQKNQRHRVIFHKALGI